MISNIPVDGDSQQYVGGGMGSNIHEGGRPEILGLAKICFQEYKHQFASRLDRQQYARGRNWKGGICSSMQAGETGSILA